MTEKLRILVVDDSALVRRMVRLAIESDPMLEVAGVAANGRIALQMVTQLGLDAITLDLEMPEMNGIETLQALRSSGCRLPVVVFSAQTSQGARATLDALASGADDYVTKPGRINNPEEGVAAIRESLVPCLKALCQAASRLSRIGERSAPPCAASSESGQTVEIVAIGTSTGGPNALATVIPLIPADFPVPVVVVQHMPPTFTRFLAERLNHVSALPVQEALAGERLLPGHVWIAQGDHHLVLRREGEAVYLELNRQPPENSCRPAVDVTFRSVAELYGASALAVVMTGMGQDGLRGSEAIHRQGGEIYVQDEPTSVVWGMPGFVVRAGLASKVLPVSEIAGEIVRRVTKNRAAVPLALAASTRW
jgi:two-component system chemotaxis response regulator CheB